MGILGVIVLILVLYFSFRTTFLKVIFTKVQEKMHNSYALDLRADKIGFSGFKTVTIQGLQIKQDTSALLFIDTLKVNPRIFPLITGKILLKEIDLRQGQFNFNIHQLRRIRKVTSAHPDSVEESSSGTNYSKIAYNIIHTYFQYIPSLLKVNRFTIRYQHDTLYARGVISDFLLKSHRYSGKALISDNRIGETVLFNGLVDDSENRISFNLRNAEKKTITLPYVGPKWNSVISFDSIFGQFKVERYRGDVLDLNVSSGIHNFVINDTRIGPEPVITRKGAGNLNIRISEKAFEIDSTSKVSFNEFQFSPYFKFEKNPNRIVELKIIRQEFEASKLFKSFPEGLFDNVPKLETKGNLAYSLDLKLNLDYPDSVTLDSRMDKDGFAILKYGGDDFRKMNGSFRYDVYDHNRFVRSFTVGPENPDFTPLEQVSPYLKYSILTSEDGDFFYHRGFNEKAFQESISKNWQEKRFARGGSTISMQLVKNVFLSRKKTIARKVEEMLIVWMIENLRLTSKERMFEVYLNIIEWGPNIYGIKEASRFYFNKQPSQLNLKESIYLTSIVPRPKAFKYAFDSTGRLRSHYAGYYRLISGIMLRRNQISPNDTVNLRPDVELSGAAKYYISKQENDREDSIFYIQPRKFLFDLFKRNKNDDSEKKGLFR